MDKIIQVILLICIIITLALLSISQHNNYKVVQSCKLKSYNISNTDKEFQYNVNKCVFETTNKTLLWAKWR